MTVSLGVIILSAVISHGSLRWGACGEESWWLYDKKHCVCKCAVGTRRAAQAPLGSWKHSAPNISLTERASLSFFSFALKKNKVEDFNRIKKFRNFAMKIMKLEVLGPHCMSHSATLGYSLYTDPDAKTERWGSIRKHKGFIGKSKSVKEQKEAPPPTPPPETRWGGGGRVQTPGSSQQRREADTSVTR